MSEAVELHEEEAPEPRATKFQRKLAYYLTARMAQDGLSLSDPGVPPSRRSPVRILLRRMCSSRDVARLLRRACGTRTRNVDRLTAIERH